MTEDHLMDTQAERLMELLAKATEGEWSIWPQPIADAADAIAELRHQVEHTKPLEPVLYMLNADGKCPALTGCGEYSKANAELIVAMKNALPALLTERASLLARVDELEKGLRPFARAIVYGARRPLDLVTPSDRLSVTHIADGRITLGDFRTARSLLPDAGEGNG